MSVVDAPAVTEQTGPTFYLGAPPHWARDSRVPLMVSANALRRYRSRGERFPSARCRWALDSAGFSQISDHGEFLLDPDEYGGMVYRLMDEFGAPPDFVSVQDWMTEPQILARSGFSLLQHQQFTVESYLYLAREYEHAPWIPILQGQSLEDYLRHADMFEEAGVDLTAAFLVGVGSVCRRQGTVATGHILATLAGRGYALHGFGIKTEGLRRYGHHLCSADSYAWSMGARRRTVRHADCVHTAPDCRNCRRYALSWRSDVEAALKAPKQLALTF
ncbi:hypothetical protein [Kitasatospora sp. NPDC088548]|uniref:deazapurine DNA modification protein DpdA family protein n=1 Tax=Kitasatospora sp. NPDC088548 TaxID=3364075 RepID=UPI003824D01E